MAEDRERQRLAGILHDDFQQVLAYLKIKLNTLPKDQGIGEHLPGLNKVVDECIARCRNLVNEMNPFLSSDSNDFFKTLRWICRQFKERYGLDTALQACPDTEIKSSIVLSMLIRSIRELLFNVVKHSGAKHASIDVRVEGEFLAIRVEDAGRGCDSEGLKAKKTSGVAFGLFDVEDRIRFLGGTMRVESGRDEGFCVTLRVPRPIPGPGAAHAAPSILDSGMISKVKAEESAGSSTGAATGGSIRVLIADDYDLMRESLSKLLKEQKDVDIVGLAADGPETVRLALDLKPDVVLLDVNLPVMNGADATRRIRESLPETRVIALSMNEDPAKEMEMLNAGACACLSKVDAIEKLIQSIHFSRSKPYR